MGSGLVTCRTALCIVGIGLTTEAWAQSELPMPKLEVGVEAVAGNVDRHTRQTVHDGGRLMSPRVTVNLSPLWAVDAMMDTSETRTEFANRTERLLMIQARRAVYDVRGTRVSALIGSGVSTQRNEFNGNVDGRNSSRHSALLFAGFGVSQRFFRHASINAEAKFFPFESTGIGVRTSIGVSVPVGRYPVSARSVRLPFPDAGEARVGQRLSVTPFTGDEVSGVLVSATSEELRISRPGRIETIPTVSVRRVDLWSSSRTFHDRGTGIGFGAGAAFGLVTSLVWGASVEGVLYQTLGTTMLGTAAGAIIGAEVDRARSQRRTVFERREPDRPDPTPVSRR